MTKEDKIRIFIPIDEKQKTKEQFITVTINGATAQIKCGEDIEVPVGVYHVILDSGRYPTVR